MDQIVFTEISANLCVESHFRELQEQDFEVAIVSGTTAAAKILEGDGYAAVTVNFRYMANAAWNTKQAIKKIGASA